MEFKEEHTIEYMKKVTKKDNSTVFYLEDGRVVALGMIFRDKEQFKKVTSSSLRFTLLIEKYWISFPLKNVLDEFQWL